jgi:hypothetical protein
MVIRCVRLHKEENASWLISQMVQNYGYRIQVYKGVRLLQEAGIVGTLSHRYFNISRFQMFSDNTFDILDMHSCFDFDINGTNSIAHEVQPVSLFIVGGFNFINV